VAEAQYATCAPLPEGCPALAVDPSRCVDADGLVVPLVEDGLVVGALVDHDVLHSLGLPSGTWHARYPDPSDGCAPLVVSFDAEEAAPAEADRAGEVESVAVDGRVERPVLPALRGGGVP